MSEREHKRGHEGSKARREELAMRKLKSPARGHVEQEEKAAKETPGEKRYRA